MAANTQLKSSSHANGSHHPTALSPHEQAVLAAIRATPYGTVEVVVHQSKIVQVVKTEKVRLDGA